MHEIDRSHQGGIELNTIVETCLNLINIAADAEKAFRPHRPQHQELIRQVSRRDEKYDIVIGKTIEEVAKEKLDAQLKELSDSVENFLQKIDEMVKEAIKTPVSSIESALLIRLRAMIVMSLAAELGEWFKTNKGDAVLYPDSQKNPLINAVKELHKLVEKERSKSGGPAVTTEELEDKKAELVQMLADVKKQEKDNTVHDWILNYRCVDPYNLGSMEMLCRSLEEERSEKPPKRIDDPYEGLSHFDMPHDTRNEATVFYQTTSPGRRSMVGYFEDKIRKLVKSELSKIVASFELR